MNGEKNFTTAVRLEMEDMFMKKLVILFALMMFTLPVFSQTLEAGVSFDWISKTQMQRDENISQIQNVLFTDNTVTNFPNKEFKAEHKEFLKDKDHVTNYEEISKGKKEDKDKNYSGFFLKNGLLIAYGIQYKKNMKSIYYYDAMGNLRYIDAFSANYPKFPYFSYQYNMKGDLIAAFYYLSDYDQYVFSSNKIFKGRWYKENLYNRKAKIIMTSSNW